jgi:integrase
MRGACRVGKVVNQRLRVFDLKINHSREEKGRQPRTASILAADHLRPAAIAAGVVLKPGQRFGFHNLRHSLATFLINKESDTKTVQGLLRHANVSTTLGLYAQSVNSSMVKAQESMLKAILRNGSNAVN